MNEKEDKHFHLSIIEILKIERALNNGDNKEALRIISKGYIEERK